MGVTQREKGQRFRRLHEGACFVIPNPWDVGSARVLAGMGFAALATSSAASAAAIGKRDGELTREQALVHARTIVDATELPVSADLENGFGDAPAAVAETVRLAGKAGLVGCTIEDTKREDFKGEAKTGNAAKPLYDFELAVERVAAGAQAARALGFPFLLTARTHNLLFPDGHLEETVRRLQAFEKAGADVLFAPGLPELAAVQMICGSLKKPFNFMGIANGSAADRPGDLCQSVVWVGVGVARPFLDRARTFKATQRGLCQSGARQVRGISGSGAD